MGRYKIFTATKKKSEKICLVDGEKVVTNDKENAGILNRFFSNAKKNLKIPNFSYTKTLANNLSRPNLKTIMKDKNHSSISAVSIEGERWHISL